MFLTTSVDSIENLNVDIVSEQDVGKKYWYTRGIEKGFFGERLYTYFNEQFIDNKLQILINETGKVPCAFQTNDTTLDKFNTYTYSRITIYHGMTIALCRKRSNVVDVLLFRVDDCMLKNNNTENKVKVQFVDYLESIYSNDVPPTLDSAIGHIRTFFNSKLYRGRAQLVERFCINPHRIVETHLFEYFSDSHKDTMLRSFNKRGAMLFLSQKSQDIEIPERDENTPVVFRIFYRKSKQDMRRITVEGIRLDLVTDEHIRHYAQYNGDKHQLVKVFIAGHTTPVYGISNYGKKIRLIYRVGDRYRSFLLNNAETAMITQLEMCNMDQLKRK